MSTIIIGSNHSNTAEYYKNLGIPVSSLVLHTNHGLSVGHTSIQDIPDHDELELVLKNASEVYWAESHISEFSSADGFYDFLYWLQLYNLKHKNVKNFHKITFDPYNWNFDLPKLTNGDMVFLGNSITAGFGLDHMDDCFTNKLAKHFNKNCVNLAFKFNNNNGYGIANNDKIFDIFLGLDFVEHQLVVIHLAPFDRIRYCNETNTLTDIQLAQYKGKNFLELIDVFSRSYLFYRTLAQIKAMIQLARSKKLKLIVCLDNYKIDHTRQIEQLYLYEYQEVVPKTLLENFVIDVGNDNLHPGVASHDLLARTVIEYIKTIYGT